TPTAPCGGCAPCRQGRENLCERQFEGIVLGAYADYLLASEKVAARHLLHKPDEISYIEAAFLEPLSCVIHAWDRLRPHPAGRVDEWCCLPVSPRAHGSRSMRHDCTTRRSTSSTPSITAPATSKRPISCWRAVPLTSGLWSPG